jgi:hypothetical protein
MAMEHVKFICYIVWNSKPPSLTQSLSPSAPEFQGDGYIKRLVEQGVERKLFGHDREGVIMNWPKGHIAS